MNHASNPRRLAICAALTLTLPMAPVNLPADPRRSARAGGGPFLQRRRLFPARGHGAGRRHAVLHFKTAQINDVLKSLVLQDLDGGRVGVVTYPSQDPLEKTLGSFQVDISDNPSLGDLLNKLRGARVTVSAGAENFVATILGVEKRPEPVTDGRSVEKSFVNLVTDKGIRSLELEKIGGSSSKTPGCRTSSTGRWRPLPGARPGQEAGRFALQRRRRAARADGLRGRDAGVEGELPADLRRRRQAATRRCKGGRSSRTRPTTIGRTCA